MWRKLCSHDCITEQQCLKVPHQKCTYIKHRQLSVFDISTLHRQLSVFDILHMFNIIIIISVFLSPSSRWTWRHSWLWQMETWRSWVLKQTDPDNRFWLPYQSWMLERCIWFNILYSMVMHYIFTSTGLFPAFSGFYLQSFHLSFSTV